MASLERTDREKTLEAALEHDRAAFDNDDQGRTSFEVRPFDSLTPDPFDSALSELEGEGEKLDTVDDDALGGEGMPDYHNQLASAYYRIAAAEAEQEELLDEISKHQLTIAELQAELRLSVKSVTQTRVELEKVNAHLEAAQRDQEREEQERREFQKQLDSVQNSVENDADEVPINNVLRDLITAKTELAEITAERDRRRLEKKHLEEELAKVKCELAAVIADVEDTEVELRNIREENVKSGIPNIPL